MVQDAAIQARVRWASLRDQRRLDAWFDRILVNECRARLRRRRILPLGIADLCPASTHLPLMRLATSPELCEGLPEPVTQYCGTPW